MSNWSTHQFSAPTGPSLFTNEGELVFVRLAVEPRLLEALLDALSQVDFPINPELRHNAEESGGRKLTLVEFPAYAANIHDLGAILRVRGFDPSLLRVSSMLDELQSNAPSPAFPVTLSH
ncbi:MAG: hypothetical protein NTY38_14970 [Acidobacteria bacterium]|nr:hypothetical protein [Acidobacteriota bacterium]